MKVALFVCSILVSFTSSAKYADSIKVYFALNDRNLDAVAKQKIDSLIYSDALNVKEDLIILGYADYLASKEYNIGLSRARAQHVKEYLIKSGFKNQKITLCIGKGKIDRVPVNGNAGYPTDRKVEIVINRTKTAVNTNGQTISVTDITSVKTNETLRLENIFFFPGRHMVRPESTKELEKLYAVLKEHASMKIQIEGHICCKGPTSDGFDYDNGEYSLSVNRAKAIYDYLVAKGIDPQRLKYAGFGATLPLVYPETNEEDENKNRRVEVRILSK